jgi:hypothetical protein
LIVLACIIAPIAVLVIAARSSSSAHSAVPITPVSNSAETEPNAPVTTPPASGDIQSESSIDLHSSQASPEQPATKLWVNNQPVEVPDNGSTHKVMTNDNGTTTVDISSSSSMTGGSSSSSTNIEVNTDATATTETDPGP